MTLEEISYVSQVVGAIAVVASLIFVGVQLRHSAEQSKQANILARADMAERQLKGAADVVSELMRDAELAGAFRKVMFDHTELTPVESTRVLTYFNVYLNTHLSALQAVRSGLLDETIMGTFETNTAWYLTAPVFAREWRRIHRVGISTNADFKEHILKRFAELYPDRPSPMLSGKDAAP